MITSLYPASSRFLTVIYGLGSTPVLGVTVAKVTTTMSMSSVGIYDASVELYIGTAGATVFNKTLRLQYNSNNGSISADVTNTPTTVLASLSSSSANCAVVVPFKPNTTYNGTV